MARPLELKLSMVAMVAVACSPDITALLHHIYNIYCLLPNSQVQTKGVSKSYYLKFICALIYSSNITQNNLSGNTNPCHLSEDFHVKAVQCTY